MTILLCRHPRFLDWLEPVRPLLYSSEAQGSLELLDIAEASWEQVSKSLSLKRKGSAAKDWQLLLVGQEAELFLSDAEALKHVIKDLEHPPSSVQLLALEGDPSANYRLSKVNPLFKQGKLKTTVIRAPNLFRDDVDLRLKMVYLLLALTDHAAGLKQAEYYLLADDIALEKVPLANLLAAQEKRLEAALKNLNEIDLRYPVILFDHDNSTVQDMVQPNAVNVAPSAADLLASHAGAAPELPKSWLKKPDWDLWLRWRKLAERRFALLKRKVDDEARDAFTSTIERFSNIAKDLEPVALSLQELENKLRQEKADRHALEANLHSSPPPKNVPEPEQERWDALQTRLRKALAMRPQTWQAILVFFFGFCVLITGIFVPTSARTVLYSLGGLFAMCLVFFLLIRRRILKPIDDVSEETIQMIDTRLLDLSRYSDKLFSLVGKQLELWVFEHNVRKIEEAKSKAESKSLKRKFHERELQSHLKSVAHLLEALGEKAKAKNINPKNQIIDTEKALLDNAVYLPHHEVENPLKAASLSLNAARLELRGTQFIGLRGIQLESAASSQGSDDDVEAES